MGTAKAPTELIQALHDVRADLDLHEASKSSYGHHRVVARTPYVHSAGALLIHAFRTRYSLRDLSTESVRIS